MKKLLLLAFVAISFISCKENEKSSNESNTEITFEDLDSIKSETEIEIGKFLKKNKYKLSETQFSNQWKSELNDDIIQFNNKGVFVFLTYNLETYNNLLADLKKSTYEYSGKTIKNGLEIESYTKNIETIFLFAMDNPENGKKLYSLTFL